MRLVLGALVELYEFYSKLGSLPMAELLQHEYRRLEKAVMHWDETGRPYRRMATRPPKSDGRNSVISFPDRAFGVAADWYDKSDSGLSNLLVRDATAIEGVRLHRTSETGRGNIGHARKYVRRHSAQEAVGVPAGETVPAVAYELRVV